MAHQQQWSVWYPKAAATGLLVGRGQLDATEVLLLHAAPEVLTVEVHTKSGHLIAKGTDLERDADTPICRLRRDGDSITREDIWPGPDDLGMPVLLPGGEVGILTAWWHANDHKEWRWQLELYNRVE